MGANEQPVLLQRHRVTVDEYYRMGEARIFDITATETPGATAVMALPGVAVDLAGLFG